MYMQPSCQRSHTRSCSRWQVHLQKVESLKYSTPWLPDRVGRRCNNFSFSFVPVVNVAVHVTIIVVSVTIIIVVS